MGGRALFHTAAMNPCMVDEDAVLKDIDTVEMLDMSERRHSGRDQCRKPSGITNHHFHRYGSMSVYLMLTRVSVRL